MWMVCDVAPAAVLGEQVVLHGGGLPTVSDRTAQVRASPAAPVRRQPRNDVDRTTALVSRHAHLATGNAPRFGLTAQRELVVDRSQHVSQTPPHLTWGGAGDGADSFEGRLDEIALFDRRLTDAEIVNVGGRDAANSHASAVRTIIMPLGR